jgi:hypothetical protein
LALACLEVLVHIRDMSLVPDDYAYCDIEIPGALISPWTLTGEEALAKIESPVLSREFGDGWISSTTQPLVSESDFRTELVELAAKDPELADIINQSLDKTTTPVHAVPSVIIPREMNFLINPAHPQFHQLTWGEPRPFRFDPRLVASSGRHR